MKRKTESKVSDKKKKKRTNFKEKETGAKYQIKMTQNNKNNTKGSGTKYEITKFLIKEA